MSDLASGKDDTQTVAENAPEKDEEASLWAELKAAEAKTETPPLESAEEGQDKGAAPPVDAGGWGDEPTDQLPVEAQREADALAAEKQRLEAFEADRAKSEERIRAATGRIAAHQRRIEELSKAAAAPVVTRKDVTAPLQNLRADYPEIAEPLEKVVSSVREDLDALNKAEDSRREAAKSELAIIFEEEGQKLEEAHPGWAAFINANGPTYRQWIEDQPKAIRDANARNADQITDSGSAIEILAAFKQFLEPPAPDPTPKPNPPLNDKRQRQLAASSTPQSSPHGAVRSGIPESGDDQAIWNAFRDQERQRAS